MNHQTHWNHVFQNKPLNSVSWYEATPSRSLRYITERNLPHNARIIDVGGGDSLLVDHLLDLDYTDLTVLDISEQALHRAQQRLGERAARVSWVVSDITQYIPNKLFDFWHDRAAFHFLTTTEQIDTYLQTASRGVRPGGTLSVGTFAENGPKQCSDLPIRQYSADALTARFAPAFAKCYCEIADHHTPWGAVQAFTFCQFTRVSS